MDAAEGVLLHQISRMTMNNTSGGHFWRRIRLAALIEDNRYLPYHHVWISWDINPCLDWRKAAPVLEQVASNDYIFVLSGPRRYKT